jgi:hypothetical protein
LAIFMICSPSAGFGGIEQLAGCNRKRRARTHAFIALILDKLR